MPDKTPLSSGDEVTLTKATDHADYKYANPATPAAPLGAHVAASADPLKPEEVKEEVEEEVPAPYQSGHGGHSDHAIHGQTVPHVDRSQESHLPEEPATAEQAADEAAAAHPEP